MVDLIFKIDEKSIIITEQSKRMYGINMRFDDVHLATEAIPEVTSYTMFLRGRMVKEDFSDMLENKPNSVIRTFIRGLQHLVEEGYFVIIDIGFKRIKLSRTHIGQLTKIRQTSFISLKKLIHGLSLLENNICRI